MTPVPQSTIAQWKKKGEEEGRDQISEALLKEEEVKQVKRKKARGMSSWKRQWRGEQDR